MSSPFNEHAFLKWIRQNAAPDARLLVAIGDDAAVFRRGSDARQVLALDTVVEGVHAHSGPDVARVLAEKVVLTNLSDLAAMGAEPETALLSLKLRDTDSQETAQLVIETVEEVCRRFGLLLVGGDTVRGPGPMVLTLSVTGVLVGEPVTRSGAHVGDVIAVTGALGGSILGRHAKFFPRFDAARALVRLGPPSAMADVSDGLLRDLTNILTMSQVGARVESGSIPIHVDAERLAQTTGKSPLWHALNDGEDFELVFTTARGSWNEILRQWPEIPRPIAIGEVVDRGLWLADEVGLREVSPGGYDHGGMA